MVQEFDVIVIGGGSAGNTVAGRVRDAGRSVLLVEARDVGGTCPLRGCVPKKVLVAAAETLDHIATAPAHHIHTGPVRLEWPALIERKEAFVTGVAASFERGLEKRGVTVVHGAARFTGPREIDVDGTRYRGEKLLISTGSVPRTLPIPGFEHTVTSEDLLVMRERPASLVFIGAGVIALEFSHVLARAGTRVTLLEIAPRPLPMLDADLVDALAARSRALGIEIIPAAQTRRIERDGAGFVVTFDEGGQTHTRRADVVANGAGRVAALDGLDLDAAGIERDRRGIRVDDTLRSISNPAVYVAGDALGTSPQLSPVAGYEGQVVAHNLLNPDPMTVDYDAVPRVVFTVPALASVGLTEAEAEAAGVACDVHLNDMTSWRSSKTHAEEVALAKTLVERETGRIVGAHLLGHGAAEIIHLFAFARKFGHTAADLKAFVYAYPTFASDIRFML